MKATLLFSFLLLIATYAKSQDITSATITGFGLINPINLDQLNSFGFHFKIIASPDNKSIPLTMKIRITDKEGEVQDIQYTLNYLPHDFSTGRHSFVFEAPDELIAGTWKFSIEFGGKEILTKDLIIVG